MQQWKYRLWDPQSAQLIQNKINSVTGIKKNCLEVKRKRKRDKEIDGYGRQVLEIHTEIFSCFIRIHLISMKSNNQQREHRSCP